MTDKIMYVVTEGQYSDYSICGVFDNKADAELFQEKYNYDNIEEYPLNPMVRALKAGQNYYRVVMDRNGKTLELRLAKHTSFDVGYENTLRSWPRYMKGITVLGGNVVANSHEHAVKITNEMRTRLIAEGEWDD